MKMFWSHGFQNLKNLLVPSRAFPIPTALEPTFVKQAQTHFCQTRKYIYLQVVSCLMFFLVSFESQITQYIYHKIMINFSSTHRSFIFVIILLRKFNTQTTQYKVKAEIISNFCTRSIKKMHEITIHVHDFFLRFAYVRILNICRHLA